VGKIVGPVQGLRIQLSSHLAVLPDLLWGVGPRVSAGSLSGRTDKTRSRQGGGDMWQQTQVGPPAIAYLTTVDDDGRCGTSTPAGGLGYPRRGRVGGDAEDTYPAGGDAR
jgi:hypothetical protein